MTDDIVDRLRLRALKTPDEFAYYAAMDEQAADEIEELRTSIPQLIRNERERCAKVAEDVQRFVRIRPVSAASCQDIAAAIRKGTND